MQPSFAIRNLRSVGPRIAARGMRGAVALCMAAGVAMGASSQPVRAEGALRIAEQYGVNYLALTILRDRKLIEQHGKNAGLDIKVDWVTISGGASMNEALMSGSIDVASGGVAPLLTIWDRTKGDVKAVGALGSIPFTLVTRDPNVKSLKDYTKAHRIALPAIGVSIQARTLQMGAEKEFGPGKHGALDDITVAIPHPEAMAALMSGSTEISSHFSSAPFQNQALKNPSIHKVLSTYDVAGGPTTGSLAYASSKFRKENPKTYAAFLAALKEAVAWIDGNRTAAAQEFIRIEKSRLDLDAVRSILEAPDVTYTMVPERTFVFAEFLHRVGALKTKPESWRDYVFEDLHDQPGS